MKDLKILKTIFKKLFLLTTILFSLGCGNGDLNKSDPQTYTTIGQGPVTITVVNQSSMPDEKLQRVINTVNLQLDKDVKPVFGIEGNCALGPLGSRTLYIKENFLEFPSIAGKCTGFHTTGSLGYVDLTTCGDDQIFCITVSHEVIEMLSNPNGLRGGNELCDPCNSRTYAYTNFEAPEFKVSDFVYPNFYIPGAPGPYDKTGFVPGVLTPAPGGEVFATIQEN